METKQPNAQIVFQEARVKREKEPSFEEEVVNQRCSFFTGRKRPSFKSKKKAVD